MADFQEYWGITISAADFRRIYRAAQITKQRLGSRLGGRRLPSWQVQEERIHALRQRLNALDAAGYEILHADESLFNVDHYVGSYWAP